MSLSQLSRRDALKTGFAATTLASLSAALSGEDAVPARKNRIHQSACRWCYKDIPVDQLSAYGAKIGLKGIDLLAAEEWEIPRRYGLICTMGYAGGGTIADALNRPENQAAIEAAFRTNIPLAAKAGVPNVITFSGNRRGMSDDEGARNTIAGLNRVKKIAEDNGVTICMELLNSKVNHPDYMCDHTAWGVRVMEEVNSPNVKLLYDIYHMQIMEGDLIATIRAKHPMDRPLPHRRRARPSRTRRYAGSTMGRSHAGHRRRRLQRLRGARVCSGARSADEPSCRRGSLRRVE